MSGVLQKVKLTIEDETFHNVSVKWGDGYRRASTKIPHAVVVHISLYGFFTDEVNPCETGTKKPSEEGLC
ncbi:hypothetical protein [Burkholderia metallica]|uniref:hypothetical protein n=1 Tax=Burkholderia metallica TaxID=488729 RepID=UPI00158893ED|nr:hypothetical protein [Burkholderia metallica]